MKRNYLALTMSLTMGIAALSLSACSGAAGTLTVSAETISKSETDEPKNPPMQEDGSVMAKVVSLDDNNLTVILSQGNIDRQNPDGAKPVEGEAPPDLAEGETPPELPEGETHPERSDKEFSPADGETPPQMPEGESMPLDSREHPELSENAETVTVTITSATVITKGQEESADVTELTADSMVRLVLDDETVVRIHILGEKISE